MNFAFTKVRKGHSQENLQQKWSRIFIFTVINNVFTFALLSLLHFVYGVNCGHMDTVQDIQ